MRLNGIEEDTGMKPHFYEIGDKIILELFTGSVYEYYIRDANDDTDVFRFSFGSDVRFEREGLTVLLHNGYFED